MYASRKLQGVHWAAVLPGAAKGRGVPTPSVANGLYFLQASVMHGPPLRHHALARSERDVKHKLDCAAAEPGRLDAWHATIRGLRAAGRPKPYLVDL